MSHPRLSPCHRMPARHAWFYSLVFALVAPLALAQGAQPAGQVLTDKNVTEEAITKGLAGEGETRSRSPRVGMRPGQSSRAGDEPAPTGARAGAVSLLITFETNATEISPASISALDKLGRALKSESLANAAFDVEGHADPRGTADDNLRLSQGRAESVVNYLISKHGIEAARLRAVGKGDREPLNAQVPAAPENRRVTIRKQSS